MNIRILAFLLVSVSFFVFGCNNDFCDDSGMPVTLESSGHMFFTFIDENRYPVIGGWWGTSTDSIKIVRSDGQEPHFTIEGDRAITLHTIDEEWDNDAFENKKQIDYYITLSSTDTDTISMEYKFEEVDYGCGLIDVFSYSKITYRDSVYHEYFNTGITGTGNPIPGGLYFYKK